MTAVLPELDTATTTLTVVLQLQEALPAVPGQVVNLPLQQTLSSQGYWLPSTALVGAEEGLWTCYVLGKQAAHPSQEAFRVEPRSLEVLHSDGDRAFVRGTLRPGERVIVAGLHRVAPGQWVRLSQS